MLEDKIDTMDQMILLENMIASDFRSSLEIWFKDHPDEAKLFAACCRRAATFHRDMRIGQVFSKRVDSKIVESGGCSTPIIRSPSPSGSRCSSPRPTNGSSPRPSPRSIFPSFLPLPIPTTPSNRVAPEPPDIEMIAGMENRDKDEAGQHDSMQSLPVAVALRSSESTPVADETTPLPRPQFTPLMQVGDVVAADLEVMQTMQTGDAEDRSSAEQS